MVHSQADANIIVNLYANQRLYWRSETGMVIAMVSLAYQKWVNQMNLAQESIVGGHTGAKKAANKATGSFHWLRVMSDM